MEWMREGEEGLAPLQPNPPAKLYIWGTSVCSRAFIPLYSAVCDLSLLSVVDVLLL